MFTPTIPAGEFDRQVQLQLNTPVADAATGALTDSWADLGAPRWAKVRESTRRQSGAGAADAAVDDYGRPVEVTLRWFSGFDKSRTRAVLEGRVMRIVASAETLRREAIELACVEWSHG